MTDVSKTIFSGDWELCPCKGKVTIQDFEHCKVVLTDAEAVSTEDQAIDDWNEGRVKVEW